MTNDQYALSLADLLKALPSAYVRGRTDHPVRGVCFDTRQQVDPQAIFCCLEGDENDGHRFAQEAVRLGANVVIAQRAVELDDDDATLVIVDDSYRALALVASELNGHPSRNLRLIGITGTNGKGTIAHVLSAIFKGSDERVGVIGTLGSDDSKSNIATTMTTPQAPQLQQQLRAFCDDGVQTVVMEVSSIALAQDRTLGCLFDTVVFSNLSHDHLDFHGDMETYFEAKARLFTRYVRDAETYGKSVTAVLNGDDEYGRRMLELSVAPVVTYGFSEGCDVLATDVQLGADGASFVLQHEGEKHECATSLIGRFNISNALAALSVALIQGFRPCVASKSLRSCKPPPGRLESINGGQPFSVFVDYAHTPDGLEKVLGVVRKLADGNVILVFGCGGDRDSEKRPVMGKIASELADYVIITSDNPRSECPGTIIAQIEDGMLPLANRCLQPDRRTAIEHAVDIAKPSDIVLIAGKGHEAYQIIGDRTVYFDDREIVRQALMHRYDGAHITC